MRNRTLKPTRKTMLALLLLMLLELGLLVAFYMHQRSHLDALDDQLKARRADLQSGLTLTSQLNQEMATLQTDRGTLKQLEAALPTKDYIPTLLTQLQNLAVSTHNTMLSLKPDLAPAAKPAPPANPQPAGSGNGSAAPGAGAAQPAPADAKPPAPDDNYDKYVVDLSIQGKYRDVMTFILQLTHFPKVISVDTCQLTYSGAANGQEGNVTANMKFKAFILKTEQEMQAAASAANPPAGDAAAQAAKPA